MPLFADVSKLLFLGLASFNASLVFRMRIKIINERGLFFSCIKTIFLVRTEIYSTCTFLLMNIQYIHFFSQLKI